MRAFDRTHTFAVIQGESAWTEYLWSVCVDVRVRLPSSLLSVTEIYHPIIVTLRVHASDTHNKDDASRSANELKLKT